MDLKFFTEFVGLLGNWPNKFFFSFCKRYWKCLYHCLGIKKTFMLDFNVFCDFQYFLKIFSTHFTSHCPKCLFHRKRHKDSAGWVIYVERSSKWTAPWGNINKKGTIFLFLGKGFPIFDNFYKILGWNKWAVFPVVPFTR